jgi:multidrug transporter EmrE-like cation transporter
MFKILMLVLVVISNVSAQLLLREGMSDKTLNKEISMNQIFSIISSKFIIGGLFFFGLSFVLYLYVLSKFEVSRIYPIITSANFALILLFSSLFIGETISLHRIVGVAIIGIGMFILSYN